MSYSAKVWQDHHSFVAAYDADIRIQDYLRLYKRRNQGENIKIPRAMDAAFSDPQGEYEQELATLIHDYNARQIARHEQDLSRLTLRLAQAEQALQTGHNAGAIEGKRKTSEKIDRITGWLDDLHRSEVLPRDARIFPLYYSPVMIWEGGKRVVKPMRYQCRPEGKPALYDTKYPGTYEARRDALGKLWHRQFGFTHGVMVVNAFYDNAVSDVDGMQKNATLEFKPESSKDLLVACLWSQWKGKGEPDLLSFAAITDEAPPEVIAAGVGRCMVAIKPENLDALLKPDPENLAQFHSILDDCERPHYLHQIV